MTLCGFGGTSRHGITPPMQDNEDSPDLLQKKPLRAQEVCLGEHTYICKPAHAHPYTHRVTGSRRTQSKVAIACSSKTQSKPLQVEKPNLWCDIFSVAQIQYFPEYAEHTRGCQHAMTRWDCCRRTRRAGLQGKGALGSRSPTAQSLSLLAAGTLCSTAPPVISEKERPWIPIPLLGSWPPSCVPAMAWKDPASKGFSRLRSCSGR